MKIDKLIYGGFGLGKNDDNKAVFVYKSVPGDDVEIESVETKKHFSKAIIRKLITPSTDRVEPICPFFNNCGGCEHQNMTYENQLYWKNEIFTETLSRAKIDIKPNTIMAGNTEPFFYRNVIRFSCQTNEENKIEYLMHNFLYDKGDISIDKCFLQSETANTIMNSFKSIADQNIEDKSSFWQFRIREGKKTNQFMIEIMTNSQNLPKKDLIVQELRKIHNVKSIYHTYSHKRNLSDLTRNLLYGSPVIYEKIGNFTFQISPESFFQTNSLGVHTLYEKIKDCANVQINESLLDLYCGTGTIGIYLSTLTKNVVGIDIVKNAINDARDNAKINHIQNCDFISIDVEKFLSNNNDKFDKIVLDPPRSGLSKHIIEKVCKLNPKKIVYVSCNPSTFARDIKLFENFSWKLSDVQPIDMFPQTHHIECVGTIVKK